MPVSVAPLVSARPLRPITSVQRATEATTHQADQPFRPTLAPPETIGPNADLASSLRSVDAGTPEPAMVDNTNVVQRLTAFPPMDQAPMRSLMAPGFERAIQRQTSVAAAELALTHPIARSTQRAADQPPAIDAASMPAADLPLAPVTIVQRVPETPAKTGAVMNEPEGEAVQRGWFDAMSSSLDGTPSLGSLASGASTVGSGISSLLHSGGAHATPEGDMDELATKLYDKIRARLKSELLIDRERSGFLTDLR